MSTVHAAKTRALQALERGQLSAAGTRRIQTHLRGCAICQQRADAIRRYHLLIADAQALAPPAVDAGRIQRALTAADPRPGLRVVWLSAVAAAAAIALGVWIHRPATSNRPPLAAPRPLSWGGSRPLSVRLLGAMGQVHWNHRHATTSISSPHPFSPALGEGGYVVTGARSVADLELSDGTRLRLGADSELQLNVLREREVTLQLHRGELFQSVTPKDYASHYYVRFLGYEARVHGTRFSVLCSEGRGTLHVEAGRVELAHPDGPTEMLTAHGHWDSHPQAAPMRPPTLSLPEDNSRKARGPTLRIALPAWPSAEWLEVNALRFPYAEPLHMRTPPRRPVELRLKQSHGAVLEARWLPSPQRPQLSAIELRQLLLGKEAIQPEGALSAARLQRTLSQAHRDFQRCFERALSRSTPVDQEVRLQVRLNTHGRVQRAGITGKRTDRSFRECLVESARRLRFPAPGGPLSFEVPLNFQRTRTAQRRNASTR